MGEGESRARVRAHHAVAQEAAPMGKPIPTLGTGTGLMVGLMSIRAGMAEYCHDNSPQVNVVQDDDQSQI